MRTGSGNPDCKLWNGDCIYSWNIEKESESISGDRKTLIKVKNALLFTPVSITPLIDTEDACFDLNASRPIAKGDLKWRDALLVAHRVSSNDFTEDSRRSVLHERERGYAYADRS